MKKIYPLQLGSITPESTAQNGFLKDNSIDDLIETYMGNLLGDKVFNFFQGNLPITVKLCDEPGHITVSPDDETALPRYGCWGRERMLYILSAKEDSSIWIGFKKDITATDIYERSQKGSILETMNEIGPEEGETFYIRPGIPFRIGEGVRYVEVAQNSPCDFNIEETDQLVEALDFINLNASNPEYVAPEDCLFRMERVAITKPQTIAPDQTESFMAIFNLDNQTSLKVKDLRGYTEISEETYTLVLIPHDIQELTIAQRKDGDNPTSSFLRIYMCNIPEPPKPEDEEEDDDECECGHHHHHHDDDECECGHHHHNG